MLNINTANIKAPINEGSADNEALVVYNESMQLNAKDHYRTTLLLASKYVRCRSL